MTQDEAVAGEPGNRAEDEPGSGVMTAFGRQLKLLRTRAGLDRTEFGKRVGYAGQSVASFEQGRRIPQPGFIDKADEVLGAGGLLLALKEELARAQYPAFFQDVARLEAEAVELCAYDTHMVKGLLQIEGYMRAVLAMRRPLLDEETIELRVAARLARQEIFSRWPAPLMGFVVEEPVLRRPLGGWDHPKSGPHSARVPGVRRKVAGRAMKTAPISPTASDLLWFKSSYSGAEGGDCVEVAALAEHVHIRDSKELHGPIVTVGPEAWTGFLSIATGHATGPASVRQ